MSKQVKNIGIIAGVAVLITVTVLVVAKKSENVGNFLGTRH